MNRRRLGCGLLLVVTLAGLGGSFSGAEEKAAPAPQPAKAAAKAAEAPAGEAKDGDAKTTDPADAKNPRQVSVWMRKKLDYSQNILAGITAGDFELVGQNANAMKGLNRIESFVRGRTPGYKAQLQIFQEANDEILRQAQRENADGAALAFTQLTISCINCHKHIREAEKP